MGHINVLKKRFLEIKEIFENGDYDHDLVYALEEEIQDACQEAFEDQEHLELKKLLERVGEFKKENDFYDADAELDRMFPDRHDDDFDEDQMSWDSVFGD